jgi:hypothetical protein
MKEKTIHTPIPWVVDGDGAALWVETGDHRIIARVIEYDLAAAGANAEFIARAVNSHAQLLEALEAAVEWRDKVFANPQGEEAWEALVGEDGCLDNEARAAIEAAKETG